MPTPPITGRADFKQFTERLKVEGWSIEKRNEYMRDFSKSERRILEWKAAAESLPVEQPTAPDALPGGLEEAGNTRRQWKVTDHQIRSLPELLELFAVDEGVWKVDRWKCGFHEMGFVRRPGKGNDLNVESGDRVPLYRAEATFVRHAQVVIDALADARGIVEAARSHMPDYSAAVRCPAHMGSKAANEHAAVFGLVDTHMGKLGWGLETGSGNYDVDVAEALFLECTDRFITECEQYNLAEIVIPLGNDLLNVDNSLNTTTNGTPQSEDGRHKKTFLRARDMLVRSIERCAQVAPVKVLCVPGNHDNQVSYYLACVLDAWFNSHPSVDVDTNPYKRKVWQFGATGIFFTHGDEKAADLPLTFATDYSDLWASTQFHEIMCGHLHTKILIDGRGCIVRFLPSLSDQDYWHSQKNYKSRRSASCFVYQRDGLFTREFQFNAPVDKTCG